MLHMRSAVKHNFSGTRKIADIGRFLKGAKGLGMQHHACGILDRVLCPRNSIGKDSWKKFCKGQRLEHLPKKRAEEVT